MSAIQTARNEGDRQLAQPVIEYWYSIRSSFTYLGAERLGALAARHGRRIEHRPMLLSIVVPGTGGIPFGERHPARLQQAWDDLLRYADYLEIPIQQTDPVHHMGPMELPSGMPLAAARAGLDADRLSLQIHAALWRDDRDIADPAVIDAICEDLGMDGPRLRAVALSEGIQTEILENSEEAVRRGYIGSPTYVVDGQAFYGQDRLFMVERALQATGAS